ncbi:MAG TPA: (Fe-S)-binding protein [Clostridia bacterium]|nr:(Fe-S)-binding protein [Clostridia bacterium]
MFHELPPIKDQLKKCVRCGQCRSVCPVFREIGTENAAPRGHVFMAGMLRDGELAPSAAILAKFNQCLLCEACTRDCPSGIAVHEIVAACRAYLGRYQPSIKTWLFKRLWTGPSNLNKIHKGARFFQQSGLRSLARITGLARAVAGELAHGDTVLGDIPSRTALDSLPRQEIAEPRTYRVGYFLGCATNLFGAATAKALIKVLNYHGCEVVVPKGLHCCGLPQYANSLPEQAKAMARANLRVFAGLPVDYIVTDCASCSSTLKSGLYREWDDPDLEKTARYWQSRIYDINAFLVQKLELLPPKIEGAPLKVTYHDPCHLARAQKIKQEPRRVLQSIPGLQLVEMEVQDQCCGGAGTFSVFQHELSMKILDRKMDLIKQTKADICATSCPACAMQLRHGLARAGLPGKVVHPVELLSQAYGPA